jgi:molybdopterin converting factor small subunit
MRENKVKVYVHPPAVQIFIPHSNGEIGCFEIPPKKGLTIKDIIRELCSNCLDERALETLPLTITINHSKMVGIEEEVKEGDRVDIHLAVMTGG